MKHCADTNIHIIFQVLKVNFSKAKALINYWGKKTGFPSIKISVYSNIVFRNKMNLIFLSTLISDGK